MVIHFVFAELVDVKAAFLYEDIKEEICMECPLCMKNGGKNHMLTFDECIHSLVLAAKRKVEKVKYT